MLDTISPIFVGIPKETAKKVGTKGCIYLGNKYQEIDIYKTKLCNPVYLDVSTSHVISIFGKRGGGKSYTMGVIAEGFSFLKPEVKDNLSIILLDTMGVYWTMTHPNKEDELLLSKVNLKPKSVKIRIFTPIKFYNQYKEQGIPTDFAFSINPSNLDSDDWLEAFRQDKFSASGVLVNEVITKLKADKKSFDLNEIIQATKDNKDFSHEEKMEVVAMFKLAETWGVFGDETTDFDFLAKPGEITVLDVSCYATLPSGNDVKALVIGLVSKHLFVSRMMYRKQEEFDLIKENEAVFKEGHHVNLQKDKLPLIWLVIDEAHEFLPKEEKDKNAATEPLKIIMREGRQPGISLILATQQPGKIHTDVMTQSDVVISHRVTANIDVQALTLLAQSYNKNGIIEAMEDLPRLKGTAVIFDDVNEKIHEIRVRPRISWHGGSAPSALTK